MFVLLTKRLARSLWRTKTRLVAVVLMVTVGVFAGISFAAYAHTASSMYDDIYADTDEGVNLADIWVENPSWAWDGSTAESICEEIANQWPDSDLVLNECEPRLKLDGVMFHTNEDGEESLIPAVWHGIDEGNVDRVWFPDHDCCSGVMASADDEIVVDVRVAEGMEVEIGDTISIGSGAGSMDYTVVGVGLHSNHLYFAQSGSIFPSEPGTFATGYLTAGGLERLGNLSSGSANLLLIDIVGTPEYDLQTTIEVEGEELSSIIGKIDSVMQDIDDSPSLVYSRSGVESVEFLRTDAEGAMSMYVPVTAMIAIVAGITIFLSLQRLVQSQAREIAILRTLGIPRNAIIPGYILMPIIIGLIGCLFGTILGVFLGAPAMLSMYERILGIPIIEPIKQSLGGNKIKKITGIINGTTNYILTEMAMRGSKYEDVLIEAKKLGYAEADPSADVDGDDAADKIAILSGLAFGGAIDRESIPTKGINKLESKDINYARQLGYEVKLLAVAEYIGTKSTGDHPHSLAIRVEPTLLPKEHPLSGVNGVNNAILIEGDPIGEVMFYGPGAGAGPTASAVVADILNIVGIKLMEKKEVKSLDPLLSSSSWRNCILANTRDIYQKNYLRLITEDTPGVIGQIGNLLGKNLVSIESIVQFDSNKAKAEIIVITHKVSKGQINDSVKEIACMKEVLSIACHLGCL